MKGRVWVRRSLETSREESTARVVPTIHSIGKVRQAVDSRLRRRATRGGARSIERPGCGSASLPRCRMGSETRTERPSVGSGRRSMSPWDSMLFRVLDKLVLSMPILGPNLVLGVPSRSMLSRAYPHSWKCHAARQGPCTAGPTWSSPSAVGSRWFLVLASRPMYTLNPVHA